MVRQRISTAQCMSTSQTAVQMSMLGKRHSQARDFSRDCLAHHLGLPRNVAPLLLDHQQQPLVLWVRVPPKQTDQPLHPKQPMLFCFPGHKMLLTGTPGWISVWLEQAAASLPLVQALEVVEAQVAH